MERKPNLPPKTMVADYQEQTATNLELINYFNRGLLSYEELLNWNKRIQLRFRSKLHLQDCYEFNVVAELVEFLRGIRSIPQELILEAANHESSHFDEAIMRGYHPKVGVWLLNYSQGLAWAAFVKVTERVASNDFYAITSTDEHRRDHHLD